ncbi:MAG: response regulator [Candidatus Melainabacteria bacterium]|nr:response regulator [Candidatus Melainabacteria bacterium]
MSNLDQTPVLLVEDSQADARYVQTLLPGSSYRIVHATSLAKAESVLITNGIVIILLDLSLPDGQGIDTFLTMKALAGDTPIVILTGLDDEETAFKAVHLGAQDYILKTEISENTLSRSIRYAIERKRNQAQLSLVARLARDAEASLKLALRASQTGVWSWNIEDDTVDCDELTLSLINVDPGRDFGSLDEFLIFVHPEDRKRVEESVRQAVDGNTDFEEDFRVIPLRGDIRHLSASGRSIADTGGRVNRITGVVREITRQKLEEENAKRLLVLEQHEDFVATLTHDLKNPLIGADRVLELMVSESLGALSEKQKSYLSLLKQGNAEMLALIQNLLQVYRFGKGPLELDITTVDMRELSESSIEQLRLLGEIEDVLIEASFTGEDHKIEADAISVKRILMNLIGNGLKFSPPGSTVVVRGRREGNEYSLEVSDQGTGIPPDELLIIFDRFTRGRQGRRHDSGTGLGLYLCKQLSEAHGGSIDCRSNPGSGTVFEVRLPVGHH